MNLKLCGVAAAVLFAFASAAQAQTSTPAQGGAGADRPAAKRDAGDRDANRGANRAERKAKDAEEERIEADYKAAKEKCDAMDGNAKDVCMKEAKGKQNVAKAELDAKKKPSERAQRKLEQAKAEAEYEVAKEKCDDLKGNEKEACQKDAKARHDQARAAMAKSRQQPRSASAGSGTSTAGAGK